MFGNNIVNPPSCQKSDINKRREILSKTLNSPKNTLIHFKCITIQEIVKSINVYCTVYLINKNANKINKKRKPCQLHVIKLNYSLKIKYTLY